MKRMISQGAFDTLERAVNAALERRGLADAWRRHVCDPEVEIETDFDWALLCAAWLLEQGAT